jgi:TPR repeat protein
MLSLTINFETTDPLERNFLISYLKKNKQYKEILNYYLSNISKNYYLLNYLDELGFYTKANYDQILPNYLEEIEAGNTVAMYCLGIYYTWQAGRGVDIKNNINLAYKYKKESADAGDNRGQAYLGRMYENGYGCEKDLKKSFDLYTKSADGGDYLGLFYLGCMYENGDGCEKDLKKALDLLTLSANKGYPDAINHLQYYSDKYIPILKEYPELWLSVIKYNGSLLRYIDNQTPEICMAAVKQDGCSVVDVKEQTHEICMAAVQQNGLALKYVKKQTAIIINTAIAKDKDAKHYIHWSYWLKSLCPNLSFNLGFHSYTPIKTD